MAYDRYDPRNAPRDDRSRWQNERSEGRERGGRDDRGFFERAGDEVASWFGDEDAERRRREDEMRQDREARGRDQGSRFEGGQSRDRGREPERGSFFGRGRDDERGRSFGGGDDDRFRNSGRSGRDFDRERERERGYRPMTGDYGRSEHESGQFFAASGVGRGEPSMGGRERFDEPWDRDEYRRTSFASSRDRGRDHDPHYHSWRQQHMSELDRDYDEYRRENQARFESEFGSWRERRQQKRGLLGQIREHMEVVGSDDQPVGTVDRVAGDRIILTKSDAEIGGGHHSLSCSDIDRIEGDRVVLDAPAEDARQRLRDESRNRALFEGEDQGEMGPRALDRSFGGTYR
jgi:hypothetical protein